MAKRAIPEKTSPRRTPTRNTGEIGGTFENARPKRKRVRHGLSRSIASIPEMTDVFERLAKLFVKESTPALLEPARELAFCILEFTRVSRARAVWLDQAIKEQEKNVPANASSLPVTAEILGAIAAIPALIAIDRFERRALSRMSHAIERFRYSEWLCGRG